MYTAGVFVPVIGGFLWKGATKAGALASLLVGSIVALWGIVGGVSLFGAPVEIFAALISLVVFVVVSLLTNK
jgi:SSS family solute:Na+ symporter